MLIIEVTNYLNWGTFRALRRARMIAIEKFPAGSDSSVSQTGSILAHPNSNTATHYPIRQSAFVFSLEITGKSCILAESTGKSEYDTKDH